MIIVAIRFRARVRARVGGPSSYITAMSSLTTIVPVSSASSLQGPSLVRAGCGEEAALSTPAGDTRMGCRAELLVPSCDGGRSTCRILCLPLVAPRPALGHLRKARSHWSMRSKPSSQFVKISSCHRCYEQDSGQYGSHTSIVSAKSASSNSANTTAAQHCMCESVICPFLAAPCKPEAGHA